MTILGIGIGIGYQRGGFSPASLFSGGEPGAWYDPSDIASMSQDDAGATPVTAAGQTVGRILDKSGRGNHATQATLGFRPTYQTSGGLHWLQFDGTDDFMVTPTITPGTDKAQVFAGVRKSADAGYPMLLEASDNWSVNNGSFSLSGGNSAGYAAAHRGTGPVSLEVGGFLAPDLAVLSLLSDIAGDSLLLRRNGSQIGSSVSDPGAGNFGAYPIYIGTRGGTSLPLNGRFYGIVARFGANLSAGQIAATEAFLASKTGVTL